MVHFIFSLLFMAMVANSLEGQAKPVASTVLSNKVAPLSLGEEVSWWAPQMAEHALFLRLGLNRVEAPRLKAAGTVLYRDLNYFADLFQRRRNVSRYTVNQYLRLLEELREYKQAVLQAALNGWVGFNYPSLIKHMIHELDYHVENINGAERSMLEELRFWNLHSKEVAEVTEHLLDPVEKQLIKEAHDFAQKLDQVQENEALVQLSLQASKELDAYGKKVKQGIEEHKVQSIINPVLLDHEARENAYAMKKLFGKE